MKNAILGTIVLLLVFNIFSPIVVFADLNQQTKLLGFSSYIDIEYDSSILNENLAIDRSVSVPITIKYWTDIPKIFLNPLWNSIWPVRNIFLFGKLFAPMQKIHIEIIDPPDWAKIYFSTPDILTNIPIGETMLVDTNLVISPRIDAPAVSYRTTIRASCESIKRVEGTSYEENIDFTPAYVPAIAIIPSEASVTSPPNKKTTIPIEIKNHANAISSITPSLVSNLSDFSIKIDPTSLVLNTDETGTFNLQVTPPLNFTGNETVEVSFTMKRYPYREGSAIDSLSIYIDLYYEPEDTEKDTEDIDFNPYLIFVIVILIVIICFLIFDRYRDRW